MIRIIVTVLSMLWGTATYGGVDGGNPTRQTFYNMAQSYRVTKSDLIVEAGRSDGSVRVDGPLTYRERGYFVIAPHAPSVANGDRICDQREVTRTFVTVYWVGSDCSHSFFKRKFGELVNSVHGLPFSR